MMKAIEETKGGDFRGKLRALSLAATVYMVWKERNYRIFRNTGEEWRLVLLKVEEELIREATWKWKARRT